MDVIEQRISFLEDRNMFLAESIQRLVDAHLLLVNQLDGLKDILFDIKNMIEE